MMTMLGNERLTASEFGGRMSGTTNFVSNASLQRLIAIVAVWLAIVCVMSIVG